MCTKHIGLMLLLSFLFQVSTVPFWFVYHVLFYFGLLLLIQLNLTPYCFYLLNCSQIELVGKERDNRGDGSALEESFGLSLVKCYLLDCSLFFSLMLH